MNVHSRTIVESKGIVRKRDRVFMARPFKKKHSKELLRIVEVVCRKHQFDLVSAERRAAANLIIDDIRKEIEQAGIMVVDLTGNNPNVLFELGIAFERFDSVILLCKEGKRLPFDLSAVRCIFFDLSDSDGQNKFFNELDQAFEAVRRVPPPVLIRDVLERTEVINEQFEKLLRMPQRQLAEQTVYFCGTLSAFAIHPKEKSHSKTYKKALLREKKYLKALARRGCTVKCIIALPNQPRHKPAKNTRIILRLQHMLEFLKTADTKERKALQNIEFIKSAFRQKNLYIMGRNVCFEGYKRGVLQGYPLTFRQDDRYAVDANIVLCEALFEELEKERFDRLPSKESVAARRNRLRKAMIEDVEQALKISLKGPKGC